MSTLGEKWDRVQRYQRDLDRLQDLALTLGQLDPDGATWRRARLALEDLRSLHRVGRPVCEGDTPSALAITIALDPMGKP